jgi:hypothetical protein
MLPADRSTVFAVAFSPTSKLLASAVDGEKLSLGERLHGPRVALMVLCWPLENVEQFRGDRHFSLGGGGRRIWPTLMAFCSHATETTESTESGGHGNSVDCVVSVARSGWIS